MGINLLVENMMGSGRFLIVENPKASTYKLEARGGLTYKSRA